MGGINFYLITLRRHGIFTAVALNVGPLEKRLNSHAFHACIQGFESPTGHQTWALSSAGRAPALQAGGRRFDPVSAHHLNLISRGGAAR